MKTEPHQKKKENYEPDPRGCLPPGREGFSTGGPFKIPYSYIALLDCVT